MSIAFKPISTELEMPLFRGKFETYIRELLEKCTFGDLAPDDLDYFMSGEYRDTSG